MFVLIKTIICFNRRILDYNIIDMLNTKIQPHGRVSRANYSLIHNNGVSKTKFEICSKCKYGNALSWRSACHSPLPAGVRTASMAFIDNQKEWDMATPRRSNLFVKSYLRCSLTAKWYI